MPTIIDEHMNTPRLAPISDVTKAYRLVCARVDELLRGRCDVAEHLVPACPAWTIRQTIAHQAGLAQDIVASNMAGKGAESWTRAQVDRLADLGTDELLDLWGQLIDPVTETLALAPQASACQLVFDALTHEHDIRGALGEPGSRAGDLTFAVALSFSTTMGDVLIRQAGLPALLMITPTIGSVQLGDPATAPDRVALAISDFEALRVQGGRRSVRQLLALPWQGDPAGLMPVFTHLVPKFSNEGLRPPVEDLLE